MHKILLATDDCVIARGLAHILAGAPDVQLTSCAFDMNSVVDAIEYERPQVVMLDMSASACLTVIAAIRKVCPECHVCLWSRLVPQELAYQAMTMGIRGILRRPLPAEDVVKCVRTLCRNEVWFEEHLMSGFFSRPAVRLTRRETDLVNLLAQGLKNKEIAYTLSLSEGTVKVYLSRLFEKLHVKDRLELALYGIRNFTAGHHAGESGSVPAKASPSSATGTGLESYTPTL